ncbi:MAG: putative major pilin subunit [Planctomycetaceae bacterium]|nr:putative major pilin subunit [Planctomycetaceae bacterium]
MNRTSGPDHRSPHRRPRSGMTLIELLIIIGIIAILVSLLLPAVQQARASSRRLHCKNNLRQVALGMLSVVETKQHFPASGYFGKYSGVYHNWVVTILPWIDQSVIYDKYDFDQPFTTPSNFDLGNTHLPVLV